MSSCAVATCKNYKKKNPNILFHRFPTDEHYKQAWILKCKRKDSFDPQYSRICSDHFTEEDYDRDLRNELLGLPSRKKLKKSSIPSKNLPLENEIEVSASSSRLENRNVRKRALERLQALSPKKKQKLSHVNEKTELELFDNSTKNDSCKRIKELEEENLKLRDYVSKLEKKLKRMSSNVEKQKKLTQYKINLVKRNTERNFQKKLNEEVMKIIGNFFSESQIKILTEGRRITKWSQKDISNAIALRAISQKCYIFLRNRMHFPLPSISTLKRWCKKLDFSEGILTPVLNVMKTTGYSMSITDKYTVIVFDEMNIDSRICYDAGKDKILGPHSNVQVVMAKGLIKHWKQPIFYAFDEQITKELLFRLIRQLEGNGFNVLAIVSDLGGKNIRLWSELNIEPKNTSFLNPHDESRKIWVFADFPHLLKLLRNHILDHGIKLASGKLIQRDIFEKILQVDSGELKICPKLSWAHIQVKSNERQNVRMAAQLLSAHTANALSYYFPDEKETSEFIKVIDGCFDVFNSRTPFSDKDLRCGFGLKPEAQNNILYKAKKYIEEMRIVGRQNLLPFQKGWLVSIDSLIELLQFLQQNDLKYFLTCRVNQDSLENLFSLIRALGQFYDHPLPIDFKYRLRQILLCNKLPLPSEKVVTKENDEENFLSSQIFNSLVTQNEIVNENNETKNEDQQIFIDIDAKYIDTTANISTISEDCSNEALRFMAGYIAFKVNDKNLGINTSAAPTDHHKNNHISWIESSSRGGLTLPTEKWFETVKKLEKCFLKFHGENNLNKCEGVIKVFSELLIREFPNENMSALKLFAKTRTFFRMKYLNRAAAFKKSQKKNKKWKKSQK